MPFNFFELRKTTRIFLLFLAAVCLFSTAKAADIEAKISFLNAGEIRVEGKITNPNVDARQWSFSQNYADATNSGERIKNLNLYDAKNAPIAAKMFIAGEFDAAQNVAAFDYQVDLKSPEKETSAAHISWLTETHGFLMTGDIFPRVFDKLSAKITFVLPNGMQIATSEKEIAANSFEVAAGSKAIFAVGRDFRRINFTSGKTAVELALFGERQVGDEEIEKMTGEIFAEHYRTFGDAPAEKVEIFYTPFPQNPGFDRWRAETRGQTVLIVSAPTTFKQNAPNRLHEQLRHEIFHLWLPNAVNLSGNYDWFFEGFSYYQALKTGVRFNQISFNDFLSTLGRGYTLTASLTRRQSVSLLEASEKRWYNSAELIYAKGTVVAFLCDVALLRESRSKRDLDTIFREVFQKHGLNAARADGNAAIIGLLKQNKELVPLLEKYVAGNAVLDPPADLPDSGIEFEKTGSDVKLKVAAKPNGRQKDLLDKLGYNQWRKILRK